METRTNPDGCQSRVHIRKPVIEILVDKNKVSGKTGSIFYRLENLSGKMTECPDSEQQQYKDTEIAAAAELATARSDRDSRAPHRARLTRG
jgi:hypothetical protein